MPSFPTKRQIASDKNVTHWQQKITGIVFLIVGVLTGFSFYIISKFTEITEFSVVVVMPIVFVSLSIIISLQFYPRTLMKRGLKHYNSGNLKKALKNFNKVIEIDHQNTGAIFYRALMKSKLGDNIGSLNDFALEAKIVFTEILEKNNKNADAYLHRGDALVQLGDFKLALKDFDKAIQLDPSKETELKQRGLHKLIKK